METPAVSRADIPRTDSGPAPLPVAGVWRRFMGATYEGVILFAVLVFFGYGFSALLQYRGDDGPMRWAFQAFLFVVMGVYFVWFWSEGRRSLPMKSASLQLVDANDRPLSRSRAAARYVVAWLLLIVPIVGARELSIWFVLLLPVPFFWALVDRQRRALYDIVAGTRLVIREPIPR